MFCTAQNQNYTVHNTLNRDKVSLVPKKPKPRMLIKPNLHSKREIV